MTTALFSDAEFLECLSSWDSRKSALKSFRGANSLMERLRQVLGSMASGGGSFDLDLTALIRQWALRMTNHAGVPWIPVPASVEWPTALTWRTAGFEVAEFDRLMEVRATPPRLSWLDQQADLFDDAFALLDARRPNWLPAEPFVASLLGFREFTGPGQREAVRALLQLPHDVTLIANLPTGTGKSMLAQLPALLHREGFLTLVIVPTVALSLDQESRMNKLFRHQDPSWEDQTLAYRGGMDTEQRSSLYQAIRQGRQRILFAAPEAVTGTLRSTLEETAAMGRLTHVIVDEAHLVASWGSGFRPAFQLIPTLVQTLREVSPTQNPIQVVLASATLTEHTVEVLQQQFGPPMRTEVISAVYLRPEPRYACIECTSDAQKRERVVEALRCAPRPFILYVTRPDEAEMWLRILRDEGMRRVAHFTGETSPQERQSLLNAWDQNALDGMVATSAFGLGVDKIDVRSIVHATMPESLDRFYQEVGRSGRDGIASASLLLFTSGDIEQATSLGGRRFIGNDLGYERWTSMLDHSFHEEGSIGEWWLDLDQLRPDLNITGRANRRWNLRTLNLMGSAGLLQLTGLLGSDPRHIGPDDAELAPDAEVRFARVRIRHAGHRDRPVFDRLMNEARAGFESASQYAFQLLLGIARGRSSVETALSQLYRLGLGSHWAPVAPLCGGCSTHWSHRPRAPLVPRPFVARLRRFETRPFRWPIALPKASPTLAFVAVDDVGRIVQEGRLLSVLLGQLRPHTVVMPRSSNATTVEAARSSLQSVMTVTFLDFANSADANALEAGNSETRVVLWTEMTMSREVLSAIWNSGAAFSVIVLGRTIPDPNRPDRPLVTVLAHSNESALIREMTS